MLLLLSVVTVNSFSCDICGCGVSNYNPFLFPHLSKNYLALTYLHRVYHTFPDAGMAGKEYYNSYTINAQVALSKKLQVLAILPYQANTLSNNLGTKSLSGFGDASVLLNYKLLYKESGSVKHSVLVGAGVKLPTGNYTPAKAETIEDQNFQLGSGSMDYLVSGSYRLAYKQWMFGASASYKYNTQNKDGFRFGDVMTTGATIVYKKEWNKLTFTPYVQLRDELQMKDASAHYLQDHSGGNAWYMVPGADLNTQRMSFGMSYQFTLDQNIAKGQIQVKPAITAHISFTI